MPMAIAPDASVAMMGWMRPYTTMQPFRKPKAVPAARQATTPRTICTGDPATRWLARQFTSVMTAPTDRSSPPISTGTVCAMATRAMLNTSLAFWISTCSLKPRGW